MDDLRTTRQREGLSQEGVAHVLGLSPSLIADIETGRTAASPTLRAAIEEVVGGRIDWIRTRLGKRPPAAENVYTENELVRQIEAYVLTGAGRRSQAGRINVLNAVTDTLTNELGLDQ